MKTNLKGPWAGIMV